MSFKIFPEILQILKVMNHSQQLMRFKGIFSKSYFNGDPYTARILPYQYCSSNSMEIKIVKIPSLLNQLDIKKSMSLMQE